MSSGLNRIEIIGNVGRDPEMRYQPNGDAVTSFSVAVNEDYTNAAGDKVKKTGWFRITAWRKLAEICNQYLKKGSHVWVEGKIAYDPVTGGPRIWTGNDEVQRANTEISASQVKFLNTRAESEALASEAIVPAANRTPAVVAKPLPAARAIVDPTDNFDTDFPMPQPPAEDEMPF